MAAPKKPEGEKIEQIKVHVRKSEKEIYTRKLFEEWMEQHRMKEGPEFIATDHRTQSIDLYTENEKALIDMVITAYRKTTNQHLFINRVKTLK